MSALAMEIVLLVGGAAILLAGPAETYRMAMLRYMATLAFVGAAVTVWALARYWA